MLEEEEDTTPVFNEFTKNIIVCKVKQTLVMRTVGYILEVNE